MSAESQSLDRLERWMLEVVTHPSGVRAALKSGGGKGLIPDAAESLESVILPSKSLSSTERLGIYSNMYVWRLIEVMGNEFPNVRHLVGHTRFDQLIRQYVALHPSRHYSLNHLGAHFPRFLAEEADSFPRRGFAVALAQVERAMEDVFDEPAPPPLSTEQLKSVPPESWAAARFKTVPALRLLTLDYPVNDYMNAVRNGRKAKPTKPARTHVVIYRTDFKVWRMDVTPERFTLLECLVRGKTLGEALETCSTLPGVNLEKLLGAVGRWFEIWTQEQLFQGIEFDSSGN